MTHYITFTVAAILHDGELYYKKIQLPFKENETVQALDSVYAIFIAGFITADELQELQQRILHVSVTADIRRV